MGRIVVNKHTNIPSGITSDSFANHGEIVISNLKGEEEIYIKNNENEVVGITDRVSEQIRSLSGSVENNYWTEVEGKNYVGEEDAYVLSNATQYTDTQIANLSGNVINNINELSASTVYLSGKTVNAIQDLENQISLLSGSSSASYESLIALITDISGQTRDNTTDISTLSGSVFSFSGVIVNNYWTSAETEGAISDALTDAKDYTDGSLSAFSAAIITYSDDNDDAINDKIDEFSANVVANYSTSADTEEALNDAKDYTDEKVEDLSGNVVTVISGFSGNVKNYIDDRLSKVYRFKGSVLTFEDLPNNAEDGDVYNVIQQHETSGGTIIPGGTNYAWNADDSQWDELGGIIDLSNYVTKDELSGDIDEVKGELSAVSATILTVSGNIISEINTLSSNTHSEIESAKTDLTEYVNEVSGNVTEKLYELSSTTIVISGNVETLSGSVETLSGSVINNYWTSAETKDYVDEKISDVNDSISSVTNNVSELSGSVIALSAGTEEKIDSAITESEGYTDEKIESLSGNVESAITGAVDEAKGYTDSVAEVITTALSAVSATAVTAIQEIQFGELGDEYIVPNHNNIRMKRENNTITIDLTKMDIIGGDYE